jgi:outer membrane protein assembly factor BamB
LIRRFDGSSGQLLGETPVGKFPLEPIAGLGAVWSENYDDGTVTRIDPATGDVVETIVIDQFEGGGPRDLAIGSSLLWAINPGTDTMVGIDPATNDVGLEVPLATAPHCLVTVAAGRVWDESCDPDPIQVFDDATGTAQGTYEGTAPIADDGTVVWTPQYDPDSTKLRALDPATLAYTDEVVDLGVPVGYVTSGFGSVWFSNGQNLYRLPFESLGSN